MLQRSARLNPKLGEKAEPPPNPEPEPVPIPEKALVLCEVEEILFKTKKKREKGGKGEPAYELKPAPNPEPEFGNELGKSRDILTQLSIYLAHNSITNKDKYEIIERIIRG